MDRSQAEALVAMLQAYFPRPELPPSTVAMWATELELHDFADGQEAIRRVARERSYPVLAECLEFLEEAQRIRIDPPLPRLSPAEFLEAMPAEARVKVDAMYARWDQESARDFDAEDAEWERTKQAVLDRPRLRGVCDGAGKRAVIVNGEPVCPDCNVEVTS